MTTKRGRPPKADRNAKIRNLYVLWRHGSPLGLSMTELARRYRVSVQRIYQIVYPKGQ